MSDLINWKNVVDRYPEIERVGGASEVGSLYIEYAERELESYLAGYYTVPFSDNNLTAKDLSIDLTYLRLANLKSEARKEFRDEVMERIEKLKLGNASMMTSSGDQLQSVGEVVYSNTKDYHPIFGVGDTLDFAVDSNQIADEDADRG